MQAIYPALAILALLAAACSQDSQTTTTAAPSAAPSVSETFTGTLAAQGTNSHPFTVAQNGEVDVTLLSVGPPPTITVGVGVGTPNGSACALSSGNVFNLQAAPTVALAGTLQAGSYCVAILDIGNIVDSVTYIIIVAHP